MPPTPKLHRAAKQPRATKFGELAANIPKTAVIPKVKLNPHFLPKMSHPNPQNIAPASRPIFWARVRRGGRPTENSAAIAGRMSDLRSVLMNIVRLDYVRDLDTSADVLTGCIE